ncbi:MAG: energy transducer TonB, partial [Sedimenticola sp.]
IERAIESKKFYPSAARRRGIEGSATLTFTVRCDGTTADIETSEGHKLLRRAAAKALKSAGVLPLPPRGLPCPLKVRSTKEYRLK